MGLLETAAEQRTDDTALIERKREEADNPRAVIGANNPPPDVAESPKAPDVMENARSVYKVVSAFLADNPAIIDEESARKANEVRDQARTMVKSLESADEAESKPLHKAWKDSKAKWKKPIDALDKVLSELSGRLQKYMIEEDDKRKAIAEEARKKAAELERVAREAEEAEHAAILAAEVGEFTDAGAAMAKADIAFDQFKEAKAEAKVATREEDVRFRSRFGSKATTLRTVETLHVDDPVAALNAMWPDDGLREALLTAARGWRKAHGGEVLPPGIRRDTEQKI